MPDNVTIVDKKLYWDADGERRIESGVSKCVLFPMGSNGTYEAGVAWNGITSINENPGGADLTDLYADNQKYASLRAAETFACTIEAYMYPDEWAECDGSAVPTGATGVFLGQQSRKAFALCYRTEIGDDAHPGMDKGYKLHFVYNCTASPSGRSYATINNSPDAITFSWEASSTPTKVDGMENLYKACSTITIDSTKVENAQYLENLERYVYGTANTAEEGQTSNAVDAAMPSPAEVINFIKAGNKTGTTGNG